MRPEDLPSIADDRLRPCDGCSRKLLDCGLTFWLLRPVRAVVDLDACRSRAAMTTLFQGNEVIASSFASRPLTRAFDQPGEIIVCEDCACTRPIAALLEVATEAAR